MIIFFALLGVLLLGAGGWAIVDGLPYLVLERGFTQVIVGTVMACGGLVLLGLSRLLVELKRVRTTLSNAMMALSVTSLAGAGEPRPKSERETGLGTGAEAAAASPAGDVGRVGDGQVSDGLAPMAAGALAGTLLATAGTIAARQVEMRPQAQPDDPASSADASASGPDLFAASAQDEVDETDAPIDLPSADLDRSEIRPAADARAPFAGADAQTGSGAEDAGPGFAPKPSPAPEGGDAVDPFAAAAAASSGRIEPRLDWPGLDADQERLDPFLTDETAPEDEFGLLRESLSARLVERPPDAVDEEPEAPHAAESWVEPARREPWFEPPEAPASDERPSTGEPLLHAAEASAALTPPPWPPLTRTPDPLDAATPASADDDQPRNTIAADVDGPETPADATDAPGADEPAPPAASNEGVVGAYQVGDAHFTIFADGSIQARTPDGEYMFASMEELKNYLASERSRLGA